MLGNNKDKKIPTVAQILKKGPCHLTGKNGTHFDLRDSGVPGKVDIIYAKNPDGTYYGPNHGTFRLSADDVDEWIAESMKGIGRVSAPVYPETVGNADQKNDCEEPAAEPVSVKADSTPAANEYPDDVNDEASKDDAAAEDNLPNVSVTELDPPDNTEDEPYAAALPFNDADIFGETGDFAGSPEADVNKDAAAEEKANGAVLEESPALTAEKIDMPAALDNDFFNVEEESAQDVPSDAYKEPESYETVIGPMVQAGGISRTPDASGEDSALIRGKVTGGIDQRYVKLLGGSVEGDINASTVVLESGAAVTGNIVAARVLVGVDCSVTGNIHGTGGIEILGSISGNVESALEVYVHSAAVVDGDVTYGSLRVDSGAEINGSCSRMKANNK